MKGWRKDFVGQGNSRPSSKCGLACEDEAHSEHVILHTDRFA